MKLYLYGGAALLLCGLSGLIGYRLAPKPKTVEKIVTKTDVQTETKYITKTEWKTKEGTIVTKYEEGQTKVVEKQVKDSAISFKQSQYELGVFRAVDKNEYEVFGAVRLGDSPFKLGTFVDINRHPSMGVGIIFSF